MTDAQEPAPTPIVPWESPGPSAEANLPVAAPPLDIGAIAGRTLDAIGSQWSLYLLLAIPGALITTIAYLLFPGQDQLLPFFAVTLLGGVPAALAGIAYMFAIDDTLTGRRPTMRSVIGRALPRFGWVLLAYLVYGLIVVAIVVVGSIGLVAVMSPPLGTLIGVTVAVAAYAAATVVFVRWSLVGPAVALEGLGPMAALDRSFVATRKNAWRIVGLYFVISMFSLPATIGGALVGAFSDDRAIVAFATFVSALLATPFYAVPTVIAFGDLTGRGYWSREVISPGKGRSLALALLVGLGGILFAVGAAVAVEAGGQAVLADRGRVLAGTATNLFDPCHPSGVATRFAATDEIWVSAVFTQRVPAFESVTIQYRRDGEYLLDAPLQAGPAGLDCYYEEEPIRDAIPGTYRITVRHGSDELSSGEFVIAP